MSVLVAGSVVFLGGAAEAAGLGFISGGISYQLGSEDGAVTAVGFKDASTMLQIPDAVENNGNSYLVTAIADNAFENQDISELTLGANVASIGVWAFASNQIDEVTIPNSMTSIGEAAFSYNLLTSITLPPAVETLGKWAFSDNSITDVSYSSTAVTMDVGVFSFNALTDVTIPSWMTTIPEGTFESNFIETLTVPEGVTTIGPYAFRTNALTSVLLPASLTSIGEGAFIENTELTSVAFAGASPDSIFGANEGNPSLGTAEDLMVHYLAEFGGEGGFTRPSWRDYDTVLDTVRTFSMNGHGSVAAQRIAGGSAAAAPAAPTAAGWDFNGWFSDEALLLPFDFSVVADADETAYAQWTAVRAVPVNAVTPSLALDLGLAVGDAVAGKTVTASGAGMKPASSYDLVVRSTPATIAFGSADASGTFAGTGVIPAGLAAGAHTVTLSGTALDGTAVTRVAYFSINAAGVVTYLSSGEAQAVLAATGFDVAPLGFAALLLLLAGGAIVLRRRRSVA